jgi:uncharacterized protein (TIGR03435 family)
MRSIPLALVIGMLAVAAISQTTQKRPVFDVISVKPAKAGGPIRMTAGGGRLIANNVTVKMLMLRAYAADASNLFPNQVIGGPKWIEADRFDVEAKVDGDAANISTNQTWMMVQSLLEDRFHLKVHHESQELPVFILTIARNGLKMTRSEDQTEPDMDAAGSSGKFYDPKKPLPRGVLSSGGVQVETVAGSAVPLSKLLPVLRSFGQRPVIDKTDLKGLFDFKFDFAPECGVIFACGPIDSTPIGSTLSAALENHLGLRLESAKAPVDVVVIESVQHPSEN